MDSTLEGGVPSPNAYTSMNKFIDTNWFQISAENPERTRWTGFCWVVHNLQRYEFHLQFDTHVNNPATTPEIELLDLDGKLHKGRKDLPNSTFQAPLGRELVNELPFFYQPCPRFVIAHALCLGLAPWLAAEVPILADAGMVNDKDDEASSAES